MKRFFGAILAFCVSLVASGSAEACCLWPFGGWWGAGYGGGYYSAGYAPYVPYYSAGYAPDFGCCAPACCDPCCSGGCSSGSCVGTTPAGGLKPATDPNFEKGTKEEEEGYDPFPSRRRRLETDPDVDSPAGTRSQTKSLEENPVDEFSSGPMGDTANDAPFGTEGEQIQNKPPMDEAELGLPANDLPAVDPMPPAGGTGAESGTGAAPAAEESFIDIDKKNDQTRSNRVPATLAVRSSGLSEVIAPKRLASRSLPGMGVRGKTSFAGKSSEELSRGNAPIRWISVPLPEGNVRL